MDVVADAGAVRRRVVVAEDRELLEAPDRDLRDVGHQVVRDSGRILAHEAALVRADGVEVAQQQEVPGRIGGGHRAHDLLEPELGGAVGVHRRERGRLPEREVRRVGVAVDRRGGGEDEVAHLVPPQLVQQHERPSDVVLVVLPGLRDGLADGLVAGEVDDGVEPLRVEDGADDGAVADVAHDEARAPPADLLDAVQGLGRAVRQVVEDRDRVARGVGRDAGVAADVAGAAGDEDVHGGGEGVDGGGVRAPRGSRRGGRRRTRTRAGRGWRP